MSAVTKQEIVKALLNTGYLSYEALADRIEQHGIAPPDGRTPVAWAIDLPYGRAYSFADEVIGKWIVEIDANGCSTHPKARHGFARQASHSEGDYVCECDGFDPYEAGYQDGIRAAWDANGTLLPDGMVLVPEVATEQIIEAIIERGNQHGDDISYDTAVLIWNDAIYAAAPLSEPPLKLGE